MGGFGLVRHLNFFKENVVIMFKFLSEYKASFYSVLGEQIVFISVNLLLFSVMVENFADVIGWNFKDFVLFLCLIDFLNVFMGIFTWKNWLKKDIVSGSFNLMLLRPLKVFWFNYFYALSHYALLYTILNFFIFSFFIFYFGIELVNIFLAVGLFGLICFFWLCLVEFFKSLDWVFLGLSEVLWKPLSDVNWSFKSFPAPLFKKFGWKYLLLVFPYYVLAILVLPVLRGYEVVDFWFYVYFLSFGSVVLCLFIFGFWKYGLKNYEAFG